MASDLLELTRMLYGAEPAARESVQKSIRSGIENAALYDELEATRGLRQLLRENPQAGVEQIAAYRPELALKYPDFQLKAQKTLTDINKNLAGTAKTQQEMQQAVMKQQAQAIVPLIDKFHMSMDSGMPEAQARQQFYADVGRTAPILEQMGIGFGQPLNESHTPELLEQVGRSVGVYTNRLKAEEEEAAAFGAQSGRMAAGVQPTAEQVYGRAEFVPGAGPVQIPGVMGGGMGAGQAVASLAGVPDRKLLALANTAKSPEEQAMITAELDRRASGGAGGFVSPQQASRMAIQQKAAEAGAVESAREQAKSEATQASQLAKMEVAFDKPHLQELIKQATPGGVAKYATEAAQFAMQDTPWSNADAQLEIISGALLQSVPRFEGPQSDADRIAYQKFAGDLANPSKTRGSRLKALDEMERLLGKYKVAYGGGKAEKPAEMPAAPAGNIVKVKSRADVEKLPSGTLFEDPQGNVHRRH